MQKNPVKQAAPSDTTAGPAAVNGHASPTMTNSRLVFERQAIVAQAFAQIVAVLMRDPVYRDLTMRELEWLVLPPLMAGQFRLAHATTTVSVQAVPEAGMSVPVALAMWANVSEELDARLAANPQLPARLKPAEWVSGGIPWLMVVAGHPAAVPEFLRRLVAKEFNGKPLKMRQRDVGAHADELATRAHAPGAAKTT